MRLAYQPPIYRLLQSKRELITSIRGMFRKDSHEKLELSVNDLVREVLKLIHGDLERRQIILQTELHDALPKITGERVPLQQVLFNLIMNAIEAMSAVTERERQLMIRAVLNERANVRSRSRIPEVESTRLTSTASSTLSLRQIPRDGPGPFHLPLNHRSAWRQTFGIATESFWNELLFNPSERRDRRLTQFTTSLQ